jgi:cellulose synthase/poly-beta-1,6-N-acetylglucosamine synthase-like glycosyltransferase
MYRPIVLAGFEALSVVLLLLTAPLTIELLLLTTASLVPQRMRRPGTERLRRLAIIVPAHNEGLLVERCVKSILPQCGPLVSLMVIAHNCADDTWERARNAGAHALRLDDPTQRGKACALRFGFAQALQAGAEAVVVVDADSVVSEKFVTNLQDALSQDADAVQCRYRVLAERPDDAPSLRTIAFQGFNLVRPRGRDRLGLSAGIFGNGFGVRREVLEKVPYSADSVVEDLEYHLQLVSAGIKVRFLEDATVYGEMPTGGEGSRTQRARWEGGRFLMMKTLPPRLLLQVFRGQFRTLEPLVDVLGLPIALEALLLAISCFMPVAWLRWYASAGLLVLLFHVLVATKAGPHFWKGMAGLLRAPAYIAWKMLLMPKIILGSRRNASWVRTQRDQPVDLCSSVNPDALE